MDNLFAVTSATKFSSRPQTEIADGARLRTFGLHLVGLAKSARVALLGEYQLLIAAGAIALLAVVAMWVGVDVARRELLRSQAEDSAQKWAVFLREQLPTLASSLNGQGLTPPQVQTIRSASRAAGLFRYKLFDAKGVIVHASRPRDIGKLNVKWYFRDLVSKGKPFTKIEDDEDFGKRTVVSESYAPLMVKGVFAGAIEVYVDESKRDHQLARLGQQAFAVLVLLLAVLACLTILVVRRNFASREEAEQSNRAKSEFLATMSHEIRTPLNGVIGMTDVLSRSSLSDRQRRHLSTIQQSAQALLGLINSILDLSRIDAGKLALDESDFSARQLVEEIVDTFAEKADSKGIEIASDVAKDIPPYQVGDPLRLRQVLTNLIGNAVKFTERGAVVVRLAVEDSQQAGCARLHFAVRDTGIGIASEIGQALFDPFHQADNSITREYGGTGLGLSISHHLIDMMGGELEYWSRRHHGSEFFFTLTFPISENSAHEQVNTASIPAGTRVIVVDDNEVNREIASRYLVEEEVYVETAKSGEAAVEKILRNAESGKPFDVAVLDMKLPGVSGLDVASTVNSDPRTEHTKLILNTSIAWTDEFKNAREHGIREILTKPISRQQLCDAVARLTGGAAEVAEDCPEHFDVADASVNAGQRILLVEDNAVNQEVAISMLDDFSCRVVLARNGIEACEKFRSSPFDLIFMDCQMPEMDGYEATKIIRQIETETNVPHTPIVALTANAFKQDQDKCMEAGMDDFVSKPFAASDLEAVLRKWTGQSESPADATAANASAKLAAHVANRHEVTKSAPTKLDQPSVSCAVDREFLLGRLGSKPDLLKRIVTTYLECAPENIATLRSGVEDQDCVDIKMASHSLKSSSGNVGASRLSELCQILEELAAARDLDKVGDAAKTLFAEFAEVETELHALLSDEDVA